MTSEERLEITLIAFEMMLMILGASLVGVLIAATAEWWWR